MMESTSPLPLLPAVERRSPEKPMPATLPKMCQNGAIVDYADCKVHTFSGAVKYGAGVFEGLRAYWNAEAGELYVFRMAEHMERLRFGMRVMRFDGDYSADVLSDSVLRMLRANDVRDNCHIRVIAFIEGDCELSGDGPIGYVAGAVIRPPAKRLETGMNFQVSTYTRNADNSMPPRVKSTANYVNNRAAEMEAKRNGYDGVLMLTREGKVSEASGACFFVVRNGELHTPDTSNDILESITRATVMQIAREDLGLRTIERRVDRHEVYAADEAFICGTAYEI
jgi:branched-chain amino acid aminotransferase